MPDIYDQLILHEGVRYKPYKCTADKLTIGVGRNLEDKGLTEDEIYYLLQNDINDCLSDLNNLRWFTRLSNIRQRVLIDMRFNLGLRGLLSFKRMIAQLKEGNYEKASFEMLDSRWAKQVGKRAERLATMMKTNTDYKE